jgi:hypothetical protein
MGLFAKVGHGKLLISLAGVPLDHQKPPATKDAKAYKHHLCHGCVSSSMVLRWTVLSPACQKNVGVTTIWCSHPYSL